MKTITTADRLIDFSKLKFELRDSMRYEDVGDYFDHTVISYDTKDAVINNAILLHEFIEYILIKSAGISPKLIDRFDTDASSREEFPTEYSLYTKFHQMAVHVEKQFIENLGLDWQTHEKIINTTPVKLAVNKVIKEIEKQKPTEQTLEKSKEVVEKVFQEKED